MILLLNVYFYNKASTAVAAGITDRYYNDIYTRAARPRRAVRRRTYGQPASH